MLFYAESKTKFFTLEHIKNICTIPSYIENPCLLKYYIKPNEPTIFIWTDVEILS